MTDLVGLSLFSNIGIGEYYTEDNGSNLKIVVANELIKERAIFYNRIHPDTLMVQGDITETKIWNKVIGGAKNHNVNFILATPPCQGMSKAGMMNPNDPRNKLIKCVVEAIEILKPEYALVENVCEMERTNIVYDGKSINIVDFIRNRLRELGYTISVNKVDAADYGTPQYRKRVNLLISKNNEWSMPLTKFTHTSVKESIGHLPSIESGSSGIPWHSVGAIASHHVDWMKNTPTGATAFDNINPEHRPHIFDHKTGNVRSIKAFRTCYKRIRWDTPAPTITMCSGSISSQNNVHPGIRLDDGTYSDARPLSIREISILTGLPENWLDDYSENDKTFNETFFRHVIGECVPPRLINYIISSIA